MTWNTYSNTTTGTYVYQPVVTYSSSVMMTPYVITPPPAPKPPGPLEWLDAEIEQTCAKARLAA